MCTSIVSIVDEETEVRSTAVTSTDLQFTAIPTDIPSVLAFEIHLYRYVCACACTRKLSFGKIYQMPNYMFIM